MAHSIKTVYVIHHSHTDIGYTDLQERVIDNQIDYISTALSIMKNPNYAGFRWNCETLFCVEQFFKEASEAEKEEFCSLVSDGKMGLSANYLNFTDLLDSKIYADRLQKWQTYLKKYQVHMNTAMIADINGISMGCRDAMIDNGVEFLFANIHCHHGMYPLYQNQNAFWWENASGKRLLVWNGEHYHLGNVLGLNPNQSRSYIMENYNTTVMEDDVEALHNNLDQYLTLCETYDYLYDFIILGVSGVFSDNAPPNTKIFDVIEAYNKRFGEDVQICMVSLQELYEAIREKLVNVPVYRGDLTDWWANGVGSTPYAVKHYKEALHRYHLCQRLDSYATEKYPELTQTIQDNLMLYAEHTWGHSSTIWCPYDTMVLNLDIRKNSYASKAHEATARMLNKIIKEKGDILRYYNTSGEIKVCNVTNTNGIQLVEFYIENYQIQAMEVQDEVSNKIITCQVSGHPRGKKISFVDDFAPYEEKIYTYRETPAVEETLNSRKCYSGSERVRDIVNDYDAETYKLPYGFENEFFSLSYEPHTGITSFIDKRTGQEMLGDGVAPIFTPLYEKTEIRKNYSEGQERSLLGRNIRGQHARLYTGHLEEIFCIERGCVFTTLCLRYSLPGTIHADVFLKFYSAMPRIDFRLELGKTISTDVESVFLPLSLRFSNSQLYIQKGNEAFRPGMDQIPGTCMEYYMSDEGLAYVAPKGGALIAMRDTPLIYIGEMKHHPIKLCDGAEQNNHRPVYSWIMNNTWETNFKMDLSGFCEYTYSLWLTEEQNPEEAMNQLQEKVLDPYVVIVK